MSTSLVFVFASLALYPAGLFKAAVDRQPSHVSTNRPDGKQPLRVALPIHDRLVRLHGRASLSRHGWLQMTAKPLFEDDGNDSRDLDCIEPPVKPNS